MASPQLTPDGLQVNATQSDQSQDAQYLSGYMWRKVEVGGGVPCQHLLFLGLPCPSCLGWCLLVGVSMHPAVTLIPDDNN